jgi:hypothetical protein
MFLHLLTNEIIPLPAPLASYLRYGHFSVDNSNKALDQLPEVNPPSYNSGLVVARSLGCDVDDVVRSKEVPRVCAGVSEAGRRGDQLGSAETAG